MLQRGHVHVRPFPSNILLVAGQVMESGFVTFDVQKPCAKCPPPLPRASTQRYVGFYDQKLPQTPPMHLGSSEKHPAAARGGPGWSKVKMSQNILRLRLGGYFAHAF